jgi:hypothetical protein
VAEQWDEKMFTIIRREAEKLGARTGQDADDIEQEIWVSFLSPNAKPGILKYQEDAAWHVISQAAWNAGRQWCEKERRATLGYHWRDDGTYVYTNAEVRRLLPLALDRGTVPTLLGVREDPGGRGGDPALGNDLLASICDVRAAYAKLTPESQEFLLYCVQVNNNWHQVGARFGITHVAAYGKFYALSGTMATKFLRRQVDDDS